MTIPADGNWLNDFEVASFYTGRKAALSRTAAPTLDPNLFWAMEGYLEAAAGWPDPGLVTDAAPPLGPKLQTISPDDLAAYQRGYATYPAALLPTRPFWERQGYLDRKAGLAPQALVIGRVPPPFGPPVVIRTPPAPPGSLTANYMNTGDITDYTSGRQVALAGRGIGDAGAGFWSQEGFLEGQARWPAPTVIPNGPAPAGPKLAPMSVADVTGYQAGYTFYPAPLDLSRPFWFRQGYFDRQNNLPAQPLVAGSPPPPFGQPSIPQPPGLPTPGGVRYLELAAFEWGIPVPYNLAVSLNRDSSTVLGLLVQAGLTFEILGDGPGDSRRGYRLSGPNGPIAQVVRGLIARGEIYPNPTAYGLPAWVGARTVSLFQGRRTPTLRLLTARELSQLGVLDQLTQPGFAPIY